MGVGIKVGVTVGGKVRVSVGVAEGKGVLVSWMTAVNAAVGVGEPQPARIARKAKQ